ncbi:MAG: hypothetical protein HKN20_11735 [Gemmatimonadetes bacterium]|nr:hypothetical protein [Gemmatimonadota bacterium]
MSARRKRRGSRAGRMQEHRRRGRIMTLAIALAAGSLLLGPAALVSIPRYDFGRLAEERPRVTAVMRETAERSVREGTTIRRSWQWVPIDAMSPHVAPAFVAALDPAFYEHRGINVRAMRGEIGEAWSRRAWPGFAPTISRRVVRELVLGRTLSLAERPSEWVLTTRIERRLSKKRILEIFLNVALWKDGVYGVEEQAQERFGRSVRALSLRESALLAAGFRANEISGDEDGAPAAGLALHRSANLVLKRMERAGFITSAEFEDHCFRLEGRPLNAKAGASARETPDS